ncbi:MAG: hypothetical protein ACI4QM_01875, partial [Alphaproteobacteria bacterium]
AQSAGLNPRIIHEYRVALVQGAHNSAEWNNMHVMAATTQVQKGLDILKAGDIASFEGYLIYWETPLKNGEMMTFKSATKNAEISPQKIGGSESYLCKQLYLTKISFDGYTFK